MSTPIFSALLGDMAARGEADAAYAVLEGVDRAACEAAISRRRKLEYRFPAREPDDHVTALDRIDHLYGPRIVSPARLFSVFPPDPIEAPPETLAELPAWRVRNDPWWRAVPSIEPTAPKEPNVFDRAKRRTVDFAREMWEIDFLTYAPGALLGMVLAAAFVIFFSEVR
jgi:hypothetical protein